MKVKPENLRTLFISEAESVDKAVQKAARHALLIRKRAGVPASSWVDGRLALTPPEEIEVEEELDDD
jgi:hypothetical protein